MFSRPKIVLIFPNRHNVRTIANVMKTKLDNASPKYLENYKLMEDLVKDLKTKTGIMLKGEEKPKKKHLAKGKMLVRDRINMLLDKNTAFLELSGLAGHGLYDGTIHSGGIVTGIGRIQGRLCMIIANDATVKGGSYYDCTLKKHLRAQEIAQENKLPCIQLADSGGATLQNQTTIFPDRDHVGRIFYNVANMSGKGIMQIGVVMGSCTAGGAVPPVLSDENIIVKKSATIHLAGPPLVKAATGEDVSAEELGGADVACGAGGIDHYAYNDEHALTITRQIIKNHIPPSTEPFDEPYESPLYNMDDMYGIVDHDLQKGFPMKEIIARIVDGSKFDEFKAKFNETLICGFGKLYGKTVGIVANNGVLLAESAMKGTHFVQLCAKRNTPLIFLQNITGFLVGLQSESSGIAKHSAKLITATACAKVPKLTVVIGGSYGAGSIAMCQKAFSPRFMYMWPNARLSIMGGQQAADVLTQVASLNSTWTDEDRQKYKQTILDKYNEEGSPIYTTARVWDDGVIDPRDTRKILGLSLAATLQSDKEETKFGTFRM